MTTQSQNIVTTISSAVFFKEFTFDKNNFFPVDGTKELADNLLWLDDLLFVIQVKERNKKAIKLEQDENKWFQNKILNEAKKQIKKSVEFFTRHKEIKIKNVRSRLIDVSPASFSKINKLIIYMPNSSLMSDQYKSMKFYESQDVGNIHIFNLEDYTWICKFLITPTELDEYLNFREKLYIKHKQIVTLYPEQYILGHFLNTNDETTLREEYLETFGKLKNDVDDFDVSGMLNNFLENLKNEEQKSSTFYYSIIKEIAKLKRYELLEFKKRFTQMLRDTEAQETSLPYRFTNSRTKCGFVFIPLPVDKIEYWENALFNFIEIYKYKRKLNKCLGVVAYKSGDYFDLNWGFIEEKWIFNKDLEEAVKQEEEFYGKGGEVKQASRYKFDK